MRIYLLLSLALLALSCMNRNGLCQESSRSETMLGNVLINDEHTRLYLDAGIIASEDKDYYFLRLDYKTDKGIPHIYPGDTLSIAMDDIKIELKAFEVLPQRNRLVAYYYINRLDLYDLGNAKTAMLMANGGDKVISADFNAENIRRIREFATKHIFPKESKPVKEGNWGFVSAGVGSAYSGWLGHRTDLLKSPTVSDYLAFGIGYVEFKYDYVNLNNNSYEIVYRKSTTDPVVILGAMFGLSPPVSHYNFAVGFTIQYYYYDKAGWERDRSNLGRYERYIINDGNPNSGFTPGLFLQAGIIWGSANTFGDWTAGVSIPIR